MGFIWPTARGWVIGLTGIIWFFIAVVNHTLFPFMIACGLVALTGASFICALLSLRGISLNRGAPGNAATS